MFKGMEAMYYERGLKEFGLFSFEKWRWVSVSCCSAQGHVICLDWKDFFFIDQTGTDRVGHYLLLYCETGSFS